MGAQVQVPQAIDRKRQSCDPKSQGSATCVHQDDCRLMKDGEPSQLECSCEVPKGSEQPKIRSDEKEQDAPVQNKKGLIASLTGHNLNASSGRSLKSRFKVYIPLYARKEWKRRVVAQDEQKTEVEVYIPPYARDDWELVDINVPAKKQGEYKMENNKIVEKEDLSTFQRFVSAASHESPSSEKRAKASERWVPQCKSMLAEEVTMNASDQLKGSTLQSICNILGEDGLNPADYGLI